MITVSCQSYASPPDVYILSASASSIAYTLYTSIAVPVGGTKAASLHEQINVDSLIQGDLPHGRLRDKEVQHLHVEGDVTFNANQIASENSDGTYLVTAKDGTKFSVKSLSDGLSGSSAHLSDPNLVKFMSDGTYWRFEGTGSLLLSYGDSLLTLTSITPKRTQFSSVGVAIATYPASTQKAFYKVETRNGSLYISPSQPTEDLARAASATLTPYCLRKVRLVSTGFSDINVAVDEVKSKCHFQLLESATKDFDYGSLSLELARQKRYVDQNILLILQDILLLKNILTGGELGKIANRPNIKDLPNWDRFQTAMKILKSRESKKLSRSVVKTVADYLADSVLSWKYVVAPDIGDIKRISQGFSKFTTTKSSELPYERLHSSTTRAIDGSDPPITVKFNLTAEVQQFGSRDWPLSREIIMGMKNCGMYPELTNLWDILPFSFAVDWFAQFGDFFESVDAYLNLENYFPIEYSISSAKGQCSYPASVLFENATGGLKVTQYERWIMEGGVPLPEITLSANSNLSNHWVEVGALVVQRL